MEFLWYKQIPLFAAGIAVLGSFLNLVALSIIQSRNAIDVPQVLWYYVFFFLSTSLGQVYVVYYKRNSLKLLIISMTIIALIYLPDEINSSLTFAGELRSRRQTDLVSKLLIGFNLKSAGLLLTIIPLFVILAAQTFFE